MGILTINSREARIKWRDLLDKVYAGSSDVVIERNGKPVAVLILVEDYEELKDELDDLRSARRDEVSTRRHRRVGLRPGGPTMAGKA